MSGSYLWVLVIILTNTDILICAFYILAIKTYMIVSLMTGRVCAVVLGLAIVLAQDQIYFLLAIPPKPVSPPKDLSESVP
jgi:hypothetical protein